jgi:hypothetical protein
MTYALVDGCMWYRIYINSRGEEVARELVCGAVPDKIIPFEIQLMLPGI